MDILSINRNYDFGAYMIRSCQDSWEYCNGICCNCHKNKTYQTNATVTNSKSRSDIIDGTPRYLVK